MCFIFNFVPFFSFVNYIFFEVPYLNEKSIIRVISAKWLEIIYRKQTQDYL